MFQDYKDLLSASQAHGVTYLIVGGYAVVFHAQPRFTKDIGVFIKADRANAEAVLPRSPSSAHRSKAFARRISRNVAASSVVA